MSFTQNIQVGPLRVRIEQEGTSVPLAGNYPLLDEASGEPDAEIHVKFSGDFHHSGNSEAEYPAFSCRPLPNSALSVARSDAQGEISAPADGPVAAVFEGLAMPHTLEAMIRLAASIALPRKDSLILHSSAIEDRRGSLVFSGVSGAGKSTIAALLADNFPVRRLSDELLLLTRKEGRWWLEVAPFTGKLSLPWGESSPLESINFLQQAPTNERTRLSAASAMAELPRHVVNYAHDPRSAGLVLDLVGDLVERIPCYQLKFRKSPSVAEALDLTCS